MPEQFSSDSPELQALAQLASVAPSRMAAAFSDPENFYTHLTLDELNRITDGCTRLGIVQAQLIAALDIAEATIPAGEESQTQ